MSNQSMRVLLCWPVDPEEIDRLNQFVGPDEHFAPTDEHMPDLCDSCRTPVWIHQDQYDGTLSRIKAAHRKLCFRCGLSAQKDLGYLRL